MAGQDDYRSPTVQSVADSFELDADDSSQKSEADGYPRQRRRRDSNATRPSSVYYHNPPVDDAVNHAFERSDAASRVDPGLVAQITEQVINTLKATGIAGVQQPQAQHHPPPPPPPIHTTSTHSRSPAESATSLPRRYTPPSPTRPDTESYRSSSPEPHMFEPEPYPNPYDMPRSKRGSSDASPARAPESRPRQVRIPSAVEETTLEKIWQPLFQGGRPTARLSQFLRGLAIHIIDDYEPKRSLVISPAKMVQFFEDVKLPNEIYPWRDIFGGRITCESISRIYRDLRCQHHFVQAATHSVPDIPALTPDGFDLFMTTLIQAHPAMEFDRLAKAVLDMPISNADNCKERFPKELSRRLFPDTDDVKQQQRLHAAISADRNIQLRSSNPMPPPPPTQPPPSSQSTPTTAFPERERAPYSSSASAIDDDESRTAPPRIERERQPYSAKEGSGRIFEDDRRNAPRQDTTARRSRANSALPTQSSYSQSRPGDIPATGQRHQRLSGSSGQRPNLGAPPNLGYPPNPYTRSEGTNIGDVPAGYYSSNMHAQEDRSRYPRRDEESKRASWYPSRGYDYDGANYDDRRRTGGTDGYGSYTGPSSRY